jgi:hypothetical protein
LNTICAHIQSTGLAQATADSPKLTLLASELMLVKLQSVHELVQLVAVLLGMLHWIKRVNCGISRSHWLIHVSQSLMHRVQVGLRGHAGHKHGVDEVGDAFLQGRISSGGTEEMCRYATPDENMSMQAETSLHLNDGIRSGNGPKNALGLGWM